MIVTKQYLNDLTVCKKNVLRLVEKCYQQNVFTNRILNMYKYVLAFNNLQWLICHKTKPNGYPEASSATISSYILLQ